MSPNDRRTAGAGRAPLREVVITHALRTPIGRFMGAFAELSAADLGTSVVKDVLARSRIDAARVGELIFGNARQAGGGPNVARQISVRAGIPQSVPAYTVNMACGSGLKAIDLAAEAIQLGRADVVVAGGTESMSGLPFLLPRMRAGYRLGHAQVVDAMYQDGFSCPLADMLMGATAEKLAQELSISRKEQDEFALASQKKARSALDAGRFATEISPVTVPGRKGETVVERDEHPRPDTTIEGLGKLPAVFDTKNGSVSAGNSSGITDGAAALVLMSKSRAAAEGRQPLARIAGMSWAGVDPAVMGIGPVPATKKVLEKTGLSLADIDVIEINEAFAAQVIACERDLKFDRDKLNPRGGGISLGHPIGMSGARLLLTLAYEMREMGHAFGLATLCISGGQGLAVILERE